MNIQSHKVFVRRVPRAEQKYVGPKFNWNEERVALLKKLWSEGLSASQIARCLGDVSRNAVIGKVHRMGLSQRATTSRKRYASFRMVQSAAVREKKLKANYGVLRVPLLQRQASIPAEPIPVETDTPDKLFKLDDWDQAKCQWPYGGFFDPVMFGCQCSKMQGIPYCTGHAARAFEHPVMVDHPFVEKIKDNSREFA